MVKVIEGSNMEELIKNLPEFFRDIVNKASEENDENNKSQKISDRAPKLPETSYKTDVKWGIIEKDLEDKIFTTIIVVAPFASKTTVNAKFQKMTNDKYSIKISWKNLQMPFSGGNIKIRDVDVVSIGEFKKIEKKSVKIQYTDGTYQISFNQYKNDDRTEFSVGMSK